MSVYLMHDLVITTAENPSRPHEQFQNSVGVSKIQTSRTTFEICVDRRLGAVSTFCQHNDLTTVIFPRLLIEHDR